VSTLFDTLWDSLWETKEQVDRAVDALKGLTFGAAGGLSVSGTDFDNCASKWAELEPELKRLSDLWNKLKGLAK
jgi:hypothetical protein